MTYYKRNGAFVRVINHVEFCGRTYAIVLSVDEYGRSDVYSLESALLANCQTTTAEEWSAAEARAVKRQRERDAEVFGLAVTAMGGYRGGESYSPRIVRVTKARYIDSTGRQWHRAGKAWNVGYQLGRGGNAYRLTKESIAAIEAACGGAAVYDFIAEGRKVGTVTT